MSVRGGNFAPKELYYTSEIINHDAPVVALSSGIDKFVNVPSLSTPTGTTNMLAPCTRSLVPSGSGYNAFILGKTVDNLNVVRASLNGTRPLVCQVQVSFTASAESAGTMQRRIEYLVNGVVVGSETIETPLQRNATYTVKKSHKFLLKTADVVTIQLVSTNAPAGNAITNTEIVFFYS